MTPRDNAPTTVTVVPDDLAALAWKPSFPRADLVGVGASMIPDCPGYKSHEGPTWRVTVAPGVVGVSTRDEAKYERTQERARQARRKVVDIAAGYLGTDGEIPQREPTREITGWSRKSRARMVRTLGELDYEPLFDAAGRLLAMLTLTYPGDWLTVAPNGKAAKRHLQALRKRYERAFGEPFLAVWKLEFQRRGAPHFHLLVRPPHHPADDGRYFREWVSDTWADVVDHPDADQRARHRNAGTGIDFATGLRSTDPRRVAVYFTKHGAFSAKEYQHCVPPEWTEPGQGPGRFWGYWGLSKVVIVRHVDPRTATLAARTLRRWSHAQQVTHETRRPRTRGGRPISKYPEVIGLAGAYLVESRRTRQRTSRTRAVQCRQGRGWVMVNDGATFAAYLGCYLSQATADTAAG